MIRPFEDRDFYDVAFLNQISYERPCTESELREKLSWNKCWVAEIGGQVIGAAICCPEDTDDPGIVRPVLWSITVAPSQRNKGWGAALIREVLDNLPTMYLYVSTDSPARHLYEREGFKVDLLLPDHYGPNQDAYLMRRLTK